MAELSEEIAAYEAVKADLEAKALGKWALVHEKKLVDVFESFEKAAETAVVRFGRGPYLIRQIGAPPIALPASVLYNPVYAENDLRIR